MMRAGAEKGKGDFAMGALGIVLIVYSLLGSFVLHRPTAYVPAVLGMSLLLNLFGLVACLRTIAGEREGYGLLAGFALLSAAAPVYAAWSKGPSLGLASFLETSAWTLILFCCLIRWIGFSSRGNVKSGS